MPTNHQAVAAFPIGAAAQASKSAARTLAVKRMAYVVSAASEVPDLVAVDPNTGDIILVIVCLGRCFLYDSTDVTTVQDGTTCLVSNDGKRYKLASGTDVFAYSVLDNTLTTPPVSPSIGDSYLVATGGTGAWSGHDGNIAVNTARGWEFVVFGTGRLIYVSAGTNIDTYYHRKADGTWAKGFGAQSLGANIVTVSAIIGKPVRWIVENQTTNTPPVSPSIGDAYVIGPVPTGAWAGNATKVAICEAGSSFTIYTPRDGELVYDKALLADFRYSAALPGWQAAVGAIIGNPVSIFTSGSGSTTSGGTGSYAYSDTVAPTTAQTYVEDSVNISYTARKTGARLRFVYQFAANNGSQAAVALFRDSDANALAWHLITLAGTGRLSGPFIFEAAAADTNAHTYKVRQVLPSGGSGLVAPSRRLFSVEEFA